MAQRVTTGHEEEKVRSAEWEPSECCSVHGRWQQKGHQISRKNIWSLHSSSVCELQFAISVNHGPHFWIHLLSSFLLSFDLPLPCCLSPLYLPWCKKGSNCPGCHLQLELLLFLSMMPTNGITTVVSGALKCPHHYWSNTARGGRESFKTAFQDACRCRKFKSSLFLSVYSQMFSLLA